MRRVIASVQNARRVLINTKVLLTAENSITLCLLVQSVMLFVLLDLYIIYQDYITLSI